VALASLPGAIATVKALKDMGQVLRGDTFASILDGNANALSGGAEAERHQAARGRVPQRVADEVVQHLLQTLGVPLDHRHWRMRGDLKPNALCLSLGGKARSYPGNQPAEVYGRHIQGNLPGFGQ